MKKTKIVIVALWPWHDLLNKNCLKTTGLTKRITALKTHQNPNTNLTQYDNPDYGGVVFPQAGVVCNLEEKQAYWPAGYCSIITLLLICSATKAIMKHS